MDRTQILQAKEFIFADIEREIALAGASEHSLGRSLLHNAKIQPGGGNFMLALALLSYTEFAGRLKNDDFANNTSRGTSKKNFDDFFNDLGAPYQEFLTQHNVYNIFRCGLAHEFYVKQDCVIAMRSSSDKTMGIGFANKQYSFFIEQYFLDFKNAFEALCQKLS